MISLFAAEGPSEIVQASGWFLSNAWLIPLFPAISFVVILFFGKRMPRGGSEVGIGAVGLSLLFALLTAGQWIGEVDGAEGSGEGGKEEALGPALAVTFEDTEIPRETRTTTAQVSDSIFSDYIIPFEAVSVLLLAALIGAIVVARRD